MSSASNQPHRRLVPGVSRRGVLGAGLAMVPLGLAACATRENPATTSTTGGATTGASGTPQQPLRVVLPSFPTSADVLLSTTGTDQSVLDNVTDSFIHSGEGSEIVPWIATEWKAVGDDRWEFTLRDGVTFTDGTPLTAEIAAWSVLQARNNSPMGASIKSVADAKATGELTVTVFTDGPAATLPRQFTSLPKMISQAWREANGDPADQQLGTGCAMIHTWEQDRQIVLKRNEDFWGEPIPWEEIVYTASSDQGTRGNAARAGEADIIFRVAPHDVEGINKAGKMRVVEAMSSRCAHIRLTDTYGPLQDKRVRQAMNYAVDVPEVMKTVFLGYGIPTGAQMQSDFSSGYHADIEPYPYDPEKAKSLLAEAGHADGFTIELSTPAGRYPNDFEFCQAIAGQLKQVGIEVQLNIRESGEYTAMVTGEREADPMIYWSTGNIVPTGENAFRDLMVNNPDISFHMNSAELMDVYERLVREFDEDERRKLTREGAEIIRDFCPVIFGYANVELIAQSPRVEWKPPIFTDRMLLPNVALLA